MAEISNPSLAQTAFPKCAFTRAEIESLAEQYGTPLYLFDEKTLRQKVWELEDAYSSFLGPCAVAYSLKANFNPSIVKTFISEGILFDLTSLGELYFFTSCGGAPENVIYTSVTEEPYEYEQVLRTGAKTVAVSSHNGLSNLLAAVESTGKNVSVLIRINPEIGVKAGIRASHREGKFGVPLNGNTDDSASKLLKELAASNRASFEGFHFHLGSQIEDPNCFPVALSKLEHFVAKMRKLLPDLQVNTLDIGGGTPVFYGKPVPTPKEIASRVTGYLNSSSVLGSDFRLIIESGRYLSSEAGVLVSRVVNKKMYDLNEFLILDSGYHLLLDSVLVRQEYPVRVVRSIAGSSSRRVHLAGRLCDTADVFPTSTLSRLDGAEQGSLVVFQNVGAYSVVFNIPFHCMTKPPIIMKMADGTYRQVRKGETMQDLFVEEGGELVPGAVSSEIAQASEQDSNRA